MLVLPDVEPGRSGPGRRCGALLEPRVDSGMQVISWQPARLGRPPANSSMEKDDAVVVQQLLQRLYFLLVDGALGERHHIDSVDLLARGNQHPVQQIQIQPFGRSELEEA